MGLRNTHTVNGAIIEGHASAVGVFPGLLQASVLLIELKLAQNSIPSAEIAHLIRTWSGPALYLLLWFGFFHSRSGLASTGGESTDKTVGQGPPAAPVAAADAYSQVEKTRTACQRIASPHSPPLGPDYKRTAYYR
jgi:hypothetical protein